MVLIYSANHLLSIEINFFVLLDLLSLLSIEVLFKLSKLTVENRPSGVVLKKILLMYLIIVLFIFLSFCFFSYIAVY